MEEDIIIDMESEYTSVNTDGNIDGIENEPTYSHITYGNDSEMPSMESLELDTSFQSISDDNISSVQDDILHTFGGDRQKLIKVREEIGDLEKIKKELDDELSVNIEEINQLRKRADGVQRTECHNELSFKGIKICATRHGCTGATNCDNELGAPVGR